MDRNDEKNRSEIKTIEGLFDYLDDVLGKSNNPSDEHSQVKAISAVFDCSADEVKIIMPPADTPQWTTQDIRKRILELCDKKGWTINKLCDEARITASTIYSAPSRNTYPSIKTLVRVCSALGISLGYFFTVNTDDANNISDIYNCLSEKNKTLLLEIAKHLL